ncbi:hypothetical protein D3C86_1538770 [compost metagenome]
MRDKRIAIALLSIDFHQLEAQLAALRLLLDAFFQQVDRLVQTPGIDVRLRVHQHIVRAFGGRRHQGRSNWRGHHDRRHHHRLSRWSWSWSWSQLDGGRRNFKAFEAAFRQIEVLGEIRLFSQRLRHPPVLFGFLLSLATTRQQQQQQGQHDRPATDQSHQRRTGQ